MEKLLELSDIVLVPQPTNHGGTGIGTKMNLTVEDKNDFSMPTSLPIFTSPMEAVVGQETFRTWMGHGIRPMLPRTEPIETRLQMCGLGWCAFGMSEVRQYFLNQDRRSIQSQFHVCLDVGNGGSVELMYIASQLKQRYKNQILLMGGNIGNPNTYIEYSKAGFDYVRCGISSGHLVDRDKFGYHYPMASLLMDIETIKKSKNMMIPRPVKIIVDGGISSYSDILKALALGADYVMIGRELTRIVEAQGTLYKRVTNPQNGAEEMQEIQPPQPDSMIGVKARMEKLCRQYHGNTTQENQAKLAGFTNVAEWMKQKPTIKLSDSEWEWVNVDISLQEWVNEFQDVVRYGFTLSNCNNWETFRKNTNVARVQ